MSLDTSSTPCHDRFYMMLHTHLCEVMHLV